MSHDSHMTYNYPVFSSLRDMAVIKIIPFSSRFILAVGSVYGEKGIKYCPEITKRCPETTEWCPETTKYCPEITDWCPETSKWCPETTHGVLIFKCTYNVLLPFLRNDWTQQTSHKLVLADLELEHNPSDPVHYRMERRP